MNNGDPSASARAFQVLQRELCFQGFFQMYRYHLQHTLFAGGWSQTFTREIFERGHAAAVLPYDPRLDQVVLIEQFRPGAVDTEAGPWLLEIVAGIIEPGQTPDSVARREAGEEAGLTVQELWPMYEFLVSPGGCTERIMLYLGRIEVPPASGVYGLAEEHEDIRAHVLPADEALHWLAQGKIRSAVPIIALQWLALHRAEVRQRWGY